MAEAPPYPLPPAHVFGPPGDLRCHDGSTWRDAVLLRQWEAAYRGRWRRPNHTPRGRYDGDTRRAVLEVQRRLGKPLTGHLGPEEWAAVWELPAPPPKDRTKPPPPKPTPAMKVEILKDRRKYWDKVSRWRVRYGTDPEAPKWFPGRPFGRNERGPHVKRVQEILGHPPTGKFTFRLTRQVAGWQRAMGLPVSGVVDVRTAAMLDPPQQEAPAQ